MKFFLVFSLWTGGPKREVPAPDPWFGFDKLEHFAASAIIQSWAHTTFRSRGASYSQASWGAAAVTASAGIGKEIWDRHHHGDFSYRDLAADGVGLISGAVMMRQIDH
jgi:putative lipoprotein